MNEWLVSNLGMTVSESILVLGFFVSVCLNFLQFFDRRAARTNALNNATIKNLETSLVAERVSLSHVKSDMEQWKKNAENQNEVIAENGIEKARLHEKISELEKLMTERPSLVVWGGGMYREAFPDDPGDHESHKFYCAICWDEKRMITQVNPHAMNCPHWSESWHGHQSRFLGRSNR